MAFLMYSACRDARNTWLSWAPPQNYFVILECSSLCLGKLIPSGRAQLSGPFSRHPLERPPISSLQFLKKYPSTHVSLTRALCTVNESKQL